MNGDHAATPITQESAEASHQKVSFPDALGVNYIRNTLQGREHYIPWSLGGFGLGEMRREVFGFVLFSFLFPPISKIFSPPNLGLDVQTLTLWPESNP